MQIPIIRASHYAISCIEGTRAGTVHSVYRRTINLQLEPSDPRSHQDAGYPADTGCTGNSGIPGSAGCTAGAGRPAGAAHPQLIALQDRDCVLSPLSLCTSLSADRLSSLPVQEGQNVLADRGGVLIITPEGMIEFGITNSTETMDLNLAAHPALPPAGDLNPAAHPALPLTAESLAALTVNISHILSLSPQGSLARIYCNPAHENDLILDAAVRCVSKTAALLQAGEAASAAETLCEGLIGLGPGLTPGGDDFLCGVLAGLYLRGAFTDPDRHAAPLSHPILPVGTSSAASASAAGEGASAAASSTAPSGILSGAACRLHAFARALRDAVPAYLENTDDISAAFLHCAAEGQFSEAIIRLAEDADAGRADSVSIADSFSKIGHTSGFDTLAGIFFSLAFDSAAFSVRPS